MSGARAIAAPTAAALVLLLAMVRLVWGFHTGDLSFEGAFVTLALGLIGTPTAYMIGRDGLAWFPWRYAAQKVLLTIPLLWGVVTLLFFLIELSPACFVTSYATSPEMFPQFSSRTRGSLFSYRPNNPPSCAVPSYM